jgi:hypothetical protein
MPTAVGNALNAATGEVGAATLKEAVKKHAGGKGVARLREIRAEIRGEMGGNIVKGPKADKLKKRLQEEGLLPNGKAKSVAPEEPVKWAKGQRDRSVPDDLKAQLAALAAQGQNKPEVKEWKPNLPTAKEKTVTTNATGNQVWARGDAKDFDKDISKEPLRRDGDKSFDKWDETTGSGSKKLGEGSYGTVMMDPKRTYAVKRGDVSDTEAKLIQKLGDADLGPKLIAADIDGPGWNGAPGVDNRRGRLAMTIVDGEPIGKSQPDKEVGGVKVADAYWTARAQLHRMGIAHNDMHIENVLVDKNGKGRFVDMGLAQDNPKAALSEAMGAFSPPRGGVATRLRGAQGQGDWQVRGWDGTAGPLMERSQRTGDYRELQAKAPVAARVLDNKNSLQYRMNKDGFSKDDIATVMDHGLRNDLSTYSQGVWQRITDQQAQEYINILYEGI